jgi:hypothetical protein
MNPLFVCKFKRFCRENALDFSFYCSSLASNVKCIANLNQVGEAIKTFIAVPNT